MQPPMQGEKVEISYHQLNSTTIINAWNSTKRQQYQIEAGVVAGFIIMFVQLIFGSFRRKSNSAFVQFLLWLANSSSYFLVSSTIGMMISSTIDKNLLPIWGICLFMVLGSTDTFSAYSLEDNESLKSQFFHLFLQSVYIDMLFVNMHDDPFNPLIQILYYLINFRVVQRISAFHMAGKLFGLQKHTKVIADHMKRLHENNQQGQIADPTNMNGYHYVVTGEEELIPKPGSYTIEIDVNALKTITVEKVWNCKGALLNPVRDPNGKLRDVCLSFALFKMLRRRFSGHPFAESQDQQTKDFVFKGLISEQGDYERAFRVIEVELSFLYDYFFTKYPVIYLNQRSTLITSLLMIFADSLLVWSLVEYTDFSKKKKKEYTDVASIITIIFVVLLIIFEFSQIVIYFNSHWAKVSLICQYVAKPHWQVNSLIYRAFRALCRVPSGKCWQNRLGQYSLLQAFRYRPKCNAITQFGLVDKKRKGQKEPWSVDIPGALKREIISALRLTNSYEQMKNGTSSLDRNGVSTNLSWACSLQSDTETILVWHVATTLCKTHTTDRQNPTADQIKVACYLSNYCAYLVAFAPELLPDNKYDSEVIIDNAVEEAEGHLGTRKRSMEMVFTELIQKGDIFSSNTVLKGAGLAKQLISALDEPIRWQILAEFWAEMILYITPSDNATDHLKHLAQGGEFVTQLWALLSHAGILERPPKTNRSGSEMP